MSHRSITAIWTKLENRADLATTLREAVGQYVMQVAKDDQNRFAPKSLQAWDRLINLIMVAFHIQRTYLQSRNPSHTVRRFLLEPSQVFDTVDFLLTLKRSCGEVLGREGLIARHMLNSLGSVLLSGLRLVTLMRAKLALSKEMNWTTRAEHTKAKLRYWPLDEDTVHRSLIKICVELLEGLMTPAEDRMIQGGNTLCFYHEHHSGAEKDLDLPNYNDGLYPLHAELSLTILRATKCIHDQCRWWLESFFLWYDGWSALVAASIKLYSRSVTDEDYATRNHRATFIERFDDFIFHGLHCQEMSASSQAAVLEKTLFMVIPFPQCSSDGCECFGRYLWWKNSQLAGFDGSLESRRSTLIDAQFQVSNELLVRQHSLQDANGHVQSLSEKLRESIQAWTDFPLEEALDPGGMNAYIINCASMHSPTSLIMRRLLDDANQSSGITDLENSVELIVVHDIFCPRCATREAGSFSQARLVKPLQSLDHDIQNILHFNPEPQESLREPSLQPEARNRDSTSTEDSQIASFRSRSQGFQNPLANHSRTTSNGATSYTSSQNRRSRPGSDSSTSSHRISYTMFTDAKFLLAHTSSQVSCYDCDLNRWSKGCSFMEILMAVGSSVRYAVISKETTKFKLTVLRRDLEFEEEEWSVELGLQPLSLCISRQSNRIALGFKEGIRIYNGATPDFEKLPSAIPQERQDSLQLDSQCMAFSFCGDHLVVSTRESREGLVYTGAYDLPPLARRNRQIHNIKIATRYPQDLHLSSVIYHQCSGAICICSSTAQGHTFVTDISTQRFDQLQRMGIDRVQCGTEMPGTEPQMVLVNDDNKIFLLKYHGGRWKAEPIKIALDKGRKRVIRSDEKMSIAATEEGVVRLAWMQGTKGRLLSLDPTQPALSELKEVALPFQMEDQSRNGG